MKELQEMWKQVQNKMEMMVSVASYDIWIAPLEVLDYNKYEKLPIYLQLLFSSNMVYI